MANSGQSDSRFYFRNAMPTDRGKVWAIFIIASSLFWIALVDALVVRAVSSVWLIAGAWLFLRPAREDPGFYVELEDRHIVINALWKRRIPYSIVSKAAYSLDGSAAATSNRLASLARRTLIPCS
jgi:hypothetical protein